MKILLALFAAANLTADASALTTIESRRTADKSYAQISKVSRTSSIECADRECTITWEPKPGAQVPPEVLRRAADHARMKALARKWRDADLSPAEKDELIKLFLVAELAAD